MRIKLKFYFAFSVLIYLSGLKLFAQDGSPSTTEIPELNHHPELNLNDDKTLLIDESKATKTQTNNVNAPANNSKSKTDNQNKPSANDKNTEDPLSFNFLYFIIQKFKISDIVDD